MRSFRVQWLTSRNSRSILRLLLTSCRISIKLKKPRLHAINCGTKPFLRQMEKSQDRLPMMIDAIPAMAWSSLPDGSAEFLNRRWLDFTGLAAEEASDWGWAAALHPEERERLLDSWGHLPL